MFLSPPQSAVLILCNCVPKGSRCILSVHLPRNFQYKYGSIDSRVSYQHLSTSVNMYQHSIYMQQHIATLAKFNCLENFHKKIRAYIYRSLNQHMSTLVNIYQHSSNMLHLLHLRRSRNWFDPVMSNHVAPQSQRSSSRLANPNIGVIGLW